MLSEPDDEKSPALDKGTYADFINLLYYSLKYRKCDAQTIELTLSAFLAGASVALDTEFSVE